MTTPLNNAAYILFILYKQQISMKKILLSAAFLLAVTTVMNAQAPAHDHSDPNHTHANGSAHGQGDKHHKTPEEKAAKGAEKMKTELGLSADQKTKVEALMLEKGKKISDIKA